jgi:bilin biosynthesis protein
MDAILETQAENDALIQRVSEQISLETFDTTDQELLNRLVEGLGDPRGLMRLRFAETLGEIGEPATPYLVSALASHPNVVVRRAAAKTLTLIADPVAVPTLLHSFLNDEDTVVRGSSAGALARTGEAAAPALLDILASSQHPEDTKGHAAWALAFMGSEAEEYLYKALNSESLDVRCAVIGAIAHVAQEQLAGDPLGQASDNPGRLDPLPHGQHEKSCTILINALTDPEPLIRAEAAAAIGQLNYPPAVPHLILALQDADLDVQKAAVSSLGKLGDRSALPLLQARLNHELPVIQTLAKLAIQQIERQDEDGW